MTDHEGSDQVSATWLVCIPKIFAALADEILATLGATSITRLSGDSYLIKTSSPQAIRASEAAKFVRWNLPIQHMWPCNPTRMDGFVEKAAQTLWSKFGPKQPQGIFMGQLNPGGPNAYFRRLASNLRGRTLQLFPDLKAPTVEEQNPDAETLFCLVAKEGLFCGMQSPKASNGLYPGGSKFVDIDSPDTISRAGAKIAEALHYLLMYRKPMAAGSHWLELGACPGGMTSELLARDQRVTAIDRAPLDQRLMDQKGLRFVLSDVAHYEPKDGATFDAILSDLNGPPSESMDHVIRLSPHLSKQGLVVFTLKVSHVTELEGPSRLFLDIVEQATQAGLRLFAQTHLTYNRHEFTLFFERGRL